MDAGSLTRSLRAAAVALVGLAMLILGTPGLDSLADDALLGPDDRAQAFARPLGMFGVAAADLNRAVRLPLVRALQPLQRPLRIAQSWALYPRGPAKVRRLEIEIDGVVRTRSNDAELDWLGSVLRYRRVRPVVTALCYGRSRSAGGLVDYIGHRATQDFPGARQLVVRCTIAPWPSNGKPGPPKVSLELQLALPAAP